VGKHVSGVGPVGDLDTLTHADEVGSVLADDITTTDGLHADFFLGPLAANTFTVEIRHLAVVPSERFRNNLTHADRGARGAVLLHFMVRFDDLHVEVIAKDLCHVLEDLEHHVDTNRHIGGEHHRNRAGQFHGKGAFLRAETGGADHHRLAVQSTDFEVFQRDRWCGKVDQNIAALDQLVKIFDDGHIQSAASGDEPGIHAEISMPGPFQCPG